jgi:hypothetical protein
MARPTSSAPTEIMSMVLAFDDMVTPLLDEFVALTNENLAFQRVRVIGSGIDRD